MGACSNLGGLRVVPGISGNVGGFGRGAFDDIGDEFPPPSAVAFSRVAPVGPAPLVTRVSPCVYYAVCVKSAKYYVVGLSRKAGGLMTVRARSERKVRL